MLQNFSFLIDDVLAASAYPGGCEDLTEDLREAAHEGITAIVTLTQERLTIAEVEKRGMAYLHLPVPDFQPPRHAQIVAFISFVEKVKSEGGAVLVHCRAGIGRTGTMLAAWLIHEGMQPEEAIREVRRRRPGSIESAAQEDCLFKFAAASQSQ